MTHDEIVEKSKKYTLYSWAPAQANLNPISMVKAKGVFFWDANDKRYMDFSSLLVNMNIGHSDPRVIKAIQNQAEQLTFAHPSYATDVRGKLGERIAEITPGDLTKSLFTLGGADGIEHAIKMARLYTGKQKVITRGISYHGATFGAMIAGGDPRRHANEPGVGWVVRVGDPYAYRNPVYRNRTREEGDDIMVELLENTIIQENPDTISSILLEGYSGSSGIIAPSEKSNYWKKVRSLCDKYNIVLIVDEVMSGFGRTGKWFGIDHYDVVPDIMVIAKGLTSGYLPLGAAVINQKISDYFDENPLVTGLTYNAHAMSCAAAIACIDVYEEDNLIENSEKLGNKIQAAFSKLYEKHSCIGDYRGKGLLTVLELVKDRESKEPLSEWNKPSSTVMNKVNKFLLENGIATFVRWNLIFVCPPLCITEEQLNQGLAILDQALDIADKG